MKYKFRVYVTFFEPTTAIKEVIVADQKDARAAAEALLDEDDDIGQDYEIDNIKFLEEVPEKPEEDPNQLKMFEDAI